MYLTKEPLTGNEKAKFILIEEEASNLAGMKIFKTVVNIFCKEGTNIAVLSYGSSKEDLFYGINTSKDNLQFFDVLSSWDEELSADVILGRFSDFKGVLCINSLTSLLIHDGIDRVCKILHKLMNNNKDLQIVALICPKVHDSYEIDVINTLSSTTLQVNSGENESELRSTVHYASGKVTCLLLEYKISANFEFVSLVDTKFQIKKKHVQQPDPTANLTFNLRLKDEEIKARNELQLPYMKMQTSDEAIIQSLLDNDLYEEEDPDDDLDI